MTDNMTDNRTPLDLNYYNELFVKNGGDIKNLFGMDSAHDELYDQSLAAITTSLFATKMKEKNVAGVQGEDRYLWWLKNNDPNFFNNVLYFGVHDEKYGEERTIYYINPKTDKLETVKKSTPSKTTSKFLRTSFGLVDGNDEYKSFLFQTVHDAGQQIINTHMPTASNFIDSAGTPKRDKGNKKYDINTETPSNYDTNNEIDCTDTTLPPPYVNCGDTNPINQTIMKKNNHHWHDTKYSLLIYDMVLGKNTNKWGWGPPQVSPNLTSEKKNMVVVNLIWQLTLYFTLKSFKEPTRINKISIWYLSHLKFLSYTGDKAPRQMKIQIISTNTRLFTALASTDPILKLMEYFSREFFIHKKPDLSIADEFEDYKILSEMQTEDIFDVSQAKCAKFINE